MDVLCLELQEFQYCKMKYFSYLLPAILLGACNNSDAGKVENKTAIATIKADQSAKADEANQKKSAHIKIMKNGQLVAEYSPNTPGAARMIEPGGKESLMLNLNSPDNQYALLGSMKNAASGTFAFGEAGQAPAQIEIYSNGTGLPPRLIPDKGQFTITLNETTCSGKFSGTKTGTDGKKYEVSGTFTNIPLVKQGSGKTY